MTAEKVGLFDRFRWIAFLAVLAGVGAAAVIEVVAARRVHIADWYMHLAMWVLIEAYFGLTTWTVLKHKWLRSLANLIVLVALTIFWCVILAGKEASERVLVEGELVSREPLHAVWLAIPILGTCTALFVVVALVVLVKRGERT
jgi:hypothetical protein